MTPLERAAYLARFARLGGKLAAARRLIASHPDYAVSTSWGKDSIVLLHLAAKTIPGVRVLNARYPNPAERFRDMDAVRDAMLARPDMAGIVYREVDTPGEWEMYERAGGFSSADTTEQRRAAKWWKEEFTRNMSGAMDDLGCVGALLGLRAEESHARLMHVIVHGADYQRRDGLRFALPLARWTGADIWAYLTAHQLPYLRIYDEASSGRERARSGFVFATGGAGALRRHGVWDDWRRVYPQEFSAWMQRFPELDK